MSMAAEMSVPPHLIVSMAAEPSVPPHLIVSVAAEMSVLPPFVVRVAAEIIVPLWNNTQIFATNFRAATSKLSIS